ncbi:uncharacterized protein STAUR_7059 [Stigmatella aurantiaca DW4/3-1]|uniref:Uncharacterized protein n=1 Tax=Stigmatella aurantiaca (strain DW4/3-1) TaxID=378806 RepID=E3FXM0_STIAD|nr:uncharacterized protein STAUR_7059 [Stigmatella aurantiaca DW4/3-1]
MRVHHVRTHPPRDGHQQGAQANRDGVVRRQEHAQPHRHRRGNQPLQAPPRGQRQPRAHEEADGRRPGGIGRQPLKPLNGHAGHDAELVRGWHGQRLTEPVGVHQQQVHGHAHQRADEHPQHLGQHLARRRGLQQVPRLVGPKAHPRLRHRARHHRTRRDVEPRGPREDGARGHLGQLPHLAHRGDVHLPRPARTHRAQRQHERQRQQGVQHGQPEHHPAQHQRQHARPHPSPHRPAAQGGLLGAAQGAQILRGRPEQGARLRGQGHHGRAHHQPHAGPGEPHGEAVIPQVGVHAPGPGELRRDGHPGHERPQDHAQGHLKPRHHPHRHQHGAPANAQREGGGGQPRQTSRRPRHRGHPRLHIAQPRHGHGEQPRAQQHLGAPWPLHPPRAVQGGDELRGGHAGGKRQPFLVQEAAAQQVRRQHPQHPQRGAPNHDAPGGHRQAHHRQRRNGPQEPRHGRHRPHRGGRRLREVRLQHRRAPPPAAPQGRQAAEAQHRRDDGPALPPARLQPHVDVGDGQQRANGTAAHQGTRRELPGQRPRNRAGHQPRGREHGGDSDGRGVQGLRRSVHR